MRSSSRTAEAEKKLERLAEACSRSCTRERICSPSQSLPKPVPSLAWRFSNICEGSRSSCCCCILANLFDAWVWSRAAVSGPEPQLRSLGVGAPDSSVSACRPPDGAANLTAEACPFFKCFVTLSLTLPPLKGASSSVELSSPEEWSW